ncbi:hypothetical protein COO91_04151 [Nostoc flagelliforme CCNUN1]|uniref:Uncharacterized protein n=1 Tax=Nostoc flagelliforme CCNUN1 TaxID=2038116 RepID=A0A2K8SRV8_9NOSO|nr:hypothetical protein COO91_04151 [Nostoc flagelliforme CCNUN1]
MRRWEESCLYERRHATDDRHCYAGNRTFEESVSVALAWGQFIG